jgi:SOS response regulatory protein OraA/RecX
MISENYKKIEAKAFWYLERYASSSKNLKDYLRKKVRDTDLNHDSELIISQIINNLEKQNILRVVTI